MANLLHQLPAQDCHTYHRRPWFNRCSFSYATQCPDATWLSQHFALAKGEEDRPLVSIYVGCNKGMDAVHTLRLLSFNASYDKAAWRHKFFGDAQDAERGRCSQELVEQFALEATHAPRRAIVYCVEAMPTTAKQLKDTAQQLGWTRDLHVEHMAMSSQSSEEGILFPVANLGSETTSISDCVKKQRNCERVKLSSFDDFVQEHLPRPDQVIDFLSIDVEGFDFEVLKGGTDTFSRRVRYLESEYNWKGPWGKQLLSDAIFFLQQHDFACYWAGSAGRLWRMTGCWQHHYELHFWSNVACVNVQIAPDLTQRMEEIFLETLRQDNNICYANVPSARTDGTCFSVPGNTSQS